MTDEPELTEAEILYAFRRAAAIIERRARTSNKARRTADLRAAEKFREHR